jgi:hypothetical protein
MDILTLTAEYLLRNEVMDGETFAAVCRDRRIPEEPKQAEAAPEEAAAAEQPQEAPEGETPEPSEQTWPPDEDDRDGNDSQN